MAMGSILDPWRSQVRSMPCLTDEQCGAGCGSSAGGPHPWAGRESRAGYLSSASQLGWNTIVRRDVAPRLVARRLRSERRHLVVARQLRSVRRHLADYLPVNSKHRSPRTECVTSLCVVARCWALRPSECQACGGESHNSLAAEVWLVCTALKAHCPDESDPSLG